MEDGHTVAKHGGGGREEPRKEETRHSLTGTLRGFDASCICGVSVRVPNPNVLVGQKYTGPLGLYSAEVQMGLSGFQSPATV